MNEGDSRPATTDPRLLIDQPRPFALEVHQGLVYVGDSKGNMVEAFAARCQETTHRGVVAEWLQQLHEGSADGDHRLFDSLFFDHFTMEWLGSEQPTVFGDSCIEVSHRKGNVIEVIGEHEYKLVAHHHVARTPAAIMVVSRFL
jgi:hypothetical protein